MAILYILFFYSLLRGLEKVDDIIADLEQAIGAACKE